jgi:hypothetical protein
MNLRQQVNKYIGTVFTVILLIIVLGSVLLSRELTSKQISERTQDLLNRMRNEDVRWAGTFIGIIPIELVGPTLELRDISEDINFLLVKALRDPNKFVAAHVLLTFRTSIINQASASQWNSLEVQLSSNGETSFEGNNLIELQKQWTERLLTNR